MNPRCEAVLPVAVARPKPLRCPGRGATRIDGVVVCRGHRHAIRRPNFVRYQRWAAPK